MKRQMIETVGTESEKYDGLHTSAEGFPCERVKF